MLGYLFLYNRRNQKQDGFKLFLRCIYAWWSSKWLVLSRWRSLKCKQNSVRFSPSNKIQRFIERSKIVELESNLKKANSLTLTHKMHCLRRFANKNYFWKSKIKIIFENWKQFIIIQNNEALVFLPSFCKITVKRGKIAVLHAVGFVFWLIAFNFNMLFSTILHNSSGLRELHPRVGSNPLHAFFLPFLFILTFSLFFFPAHERKYEMNSPKWTSTKPSHYLTSW